MDRRPLLMPSIPMVSRARRRHPILFVLLVLAALAGIAWLWYVVFSPLFDDPREWLQRERRFQASIRSVVTGEVGDAPPIPELPPWPPAMGGTQRVLVACAEAEVARGVTLSNRYHALDYPWGDVPPHLGSSPDLIVRCIRATGVDLQQLIHIDRVNHPKRYPLHLWAQKRPDTSIDHRRLPNLYTFLRALGEPHPSYTGTPEQLASFIPGDLVFWSAGQRGAFPSLAGIVLDRRDAEGTPLVATLLPEERSMSDHHRLTDWPLAGHIRLRPDRLLERFLEDNIRARLQPRPAPGD